MKSKIETEQQKFNPVSVTLTFESKKEVAAFLSIAGSCHYDEIASAIVKNCASSSWHIDADDIKHVIGGMLSTEDYDTLEELVI